MKCLGRCVCLLLALWLMTGRASQAARPDGQMVRRDWYFRESLRAIRDWEAILARLEKATPKVPQTPLLPVPASGEPVEWPNPIPPLLLCSQGKDRRVRVRAVGKQVEVERAGEDGQPKRELVAAGDAVPGYKHPGGGGKDQWYHSYTRKFDRLTVFRPTPAPLAVRLEASPDPGLGKNELVVRLRTEHQRPLVLGVRLDLHLPRESRPCGRQEVTLAAGGSQSLRFGVELRTCGGGLLGLGIEGAAGPYWIPLLVHVEDVAAVLESVGQILADVPDAAAGRRLAALRGRAKHWEDSGSASTQAAWRRLFEEASSLRDELLLERIEFDTLLFLKRKPFFSEQPFMDAHHLFNRPGGGIYRLSPVRPEGKVTAVVDSLGEGVYRDVCLHWDATRLLFSFGNGSDQWDGKQSYHIYEVSREGAGLRQLTAGPKNDCEPFYLPDGRMGFTSDRSEHFVMCGGNRHSPTLFVAEGDGSRVRQLSFNVFNDYNPTVLPDGRILYSRWEYNERSVTSLHHPFTINPDGTMMTTYYGNATIRPNVVMFPRPVPGSHKVAALFTAHHGQTHGSIGLIDVRLGCDGMEPLSVLTPKVPITGEKAEDSRWGWYSDPVPLSETCYLCSFTPTVLPWLERSWAIYVGDRHGNLALVYRDAEISSAEPVPLVRRPRPHVMPRLAPGGDAEDGEATLGLVDVRVGLDGVEPTAAKYLRIVEDVPRRGVRQGGVICTSGTLIFTIKRIFGTVPIEPDGSAHFVVPANRNVYFEVLDADCCEIQRMRSVVCLKPGERRVCIGCHEPRWMAPPKATASALRRLPSRPLAPPWGTQIVSFLRDVQPVLNAQCVRCHTHDRFANRVVLTDDLTNRFTIGYEELLPYLSVAISDRWDHPDDVVKRPPYTYGSKVSRLTELLAEGHHDVQLSEEDRQRLVNWIDANGVYYDRYETTPGIPNRRIFSGPTAEAIRAIHARRCQSCHGKDDGSGDTWWLSLNRRDVKLSRALSAPLARSAGGWQRCGSPVFADTDDADYRALLGALTSIREKLQRSPRADLLSIRQTKAQTQQVAIPAPPPPRPPLESELPEGDWVHLGELVWESATSGWTPNKDGLPRRNLDVQNRPIRLGRHRHVKGIGTHAPSEIVYRLDGEYSRFFSAVGGAESGGTVVFRVFADDKLLYESGLMHGLGEVKKIDVSVQGSRRLRLVVTDGGNNYYSDMANWASARLLKVD